METLYTNTDKNNTRSYNERLCKELKDSSTRVDYVLQNPLGTEEKPLVTQIKLSLGEPQVLSSAQNVNSPAADVSDEFSQKTGAHLSHLGQVHRQEICERSKEIFW
ncbi:hypothetical protein RUM44_012841 [Polyplax serrata]|uniref:Uncharacterized protein n=1 Tax=Polyplax serrata TaxID=468196 RepID=A0ABR1BGA1_POLSC